MTDIACFTRFLDPVVQHEENVKAHEANLRANAFFVLDEGWVCKWEIAEILHNRAVRGLGTVILPMDDCLG